MGAKGAEEPAVEEGQDLESWVQCDRCTKWRRIPAAVAEALEDDSPW